MQACTNRSKLITPSPLIVRLEEELHELRRQAVAEGHQRVGKLREGDVAGAVDVEAVERVRQEARKDQRPQNSSNPIVRAVCVEHTDHHTDGLGVEGGPVAINQGGGELFLR